jgi:hypothetical protein
MFILKYTGDLFKDLIKFGAFVNHNLIQLDFYSWHVDFFLIETF